jgi:membrane-bound lytic murein transglycosylase A
MRCVHEYGTPFFIEADLPIENAKPPSAFRRLMIAQDTGSAIVGPARADLYWGAGDEAARIANRIRHPARFVMLLPREIEITGTARHVPLPAPRPKVLQIAELSKDNRQQNRQEQDGLKQKAAEQPQPRQGSPVRQQPQIQARGAQELPQAIERRSPQQKQSPQVLETRGPQEKQQPQAMKRYRPQPKQQPLTTAGSGAQQKQQLQAMERRSQQQKQPPQVLERRGPQEKQQSQSMERYSHSKSSNR